MIGVICLVYKKEELDTKTLELLRGLKKHQVLTTYELDGYVVVGRYNLAVGTLRRAIQHHAINQK